ncbi:MAG: PAS domain S-box protein [Armatimonadota bacterium]
MDGQNRWRNQDIHSLEDRDAVFQKAVAEFSENIYTACLDEHCFCQLSVGKGVADLLGYEPEELRSEPGLWFDIVHPADEARVRQAYLRLSINQPLAEVYRIYRKDGQLQWIRVSAVASKNGSGCAYRIMGIVSDAAAERPTPDQLVKYKQLLDETPNAVSLRDISGRMVYCNEAFVSLIGRESIEEAMLTTYRDVIPAQDLPWFDQNMAAKLLSEPWSGEYRLQRKDGSLRDVSASTNVVRGLDGEPIAVYAIFTDITERKKTEQALRESEEKYRNLIERSNDGIVVIQNFVLKLVNQQFTEMSGYSAEQLIGTKFTDYLTPEENAILADNYTRRMAGEELPSIYEMEMTRADGSKIEFEINAGRITFEGLPADLVLFRDIRERKRAKEALRRSEERMRTLAEMSQEFVSTSDVDQILFTAVKTTASLLKCLCSVLGIDSVNGSLYRLSSYSENESFSNRVENALSEFELRIEDVFGEENIKPLMSPNLRRVSPKIADFVARTGVGPWAAVPLYVEGQLFGIFGGARPAGDPPFNDEDLWFFSEVASHTSAALTNALLYRRQARIAETLQRSLIPVETTVPGLEAATSYAPARGEAEVGGDFFDIIDFKNGTIGLVVGDVSGKGLDAAIHTAEAKYMLRGLAHQNSDPGYVMSALNQALWASTGDYTFVTMFYAQIDPANRTMAYVNAGHECPLILSRDKQRLRELAPNGLILGVVNDQSYVTQRMELTENDLLLCYTDGVIDVPCDGGRFGYDRLVDLVARAPSVTPQELLDYVNCAVRECSRGVQPDDQVIVVVMLKDM